MTITNADTFDFPGAQGTPVVGYHWPTSDPRGIVQLVHGGAEHAGRYDEMAQALNGVGISVYAEDHRGHGLTAQQHGRPGDTGPANSFVNICEDVMTLSRLARGQYPDLPLFLFGHSLGSLITQRILLSHSDLYQGVILSGSPDINTVAAARELVAAEAERVGRNGVSDVLEEAIISTFANAIPDARTSQDWLSRDPAEVQRYLDDPLCGFPLCTGAWLDLIDAMLCTADRSGVQTVRTDLPAYIFSGSADPVHNNWEAVSRLHSNYCHAGLTDIQVRSYSGGRHEMLKETNRAQVMEDLLLWLETHMP